MAISSAFLTDTFISSPPFCANFYLILPLYKIYPIFENNENLTEPFCAMEHSQVA